ncbi:hypothetical protein Tco_1533667 [Tanacetum coccineum]
MFEWYAHSGHRSRDDMINTGTPWLAMISLMFNLGVDVFGGFALSFQNLSLKARVNYHAQSSSSSRFHPLLPAQRISYYVRFT